MSEHLYTIGQFVRMKSRYGRPLSTPDIYRITGLLPPSNNSYQYRIRSDQEPHERVTTEDNLEKVAGSSFGAKPLF